MTYGFSENVVQLAEGREQWQFILIKAKFLSEANNKPTTTMVDQTLLDSDEREKLPVPLWKYGLIILVLAAILVPGYTFLIPDETQTQRFSNAGLTSFVTLPTAAFLIGLLGAIIPYRKRSYGTKLLRISLIAWMIPLALFDLGLLLAVFVNLVFHGHGLTFHL